MRTERLDGVDAFVVFDLDEAETSTGIVRLAPKILVDGATWLARSATYQCATFELRVGGASGGVNAKGDDRATALAAFVEAATPLVASGRWLIDPGKGVGVDDLTALRAVDPRGEAVWERRDHLLGLSVAVAAATATGGLEGRTVAIEGFDASGPALAAELTARGATITAVGTARGTLVRPDGFGDDLAAGWAERGPALVEGEGEAAPASAVLGAAVDVLVVGSKAGVVGHEEAAGVQAGVIVPAGPIPVTAKALAALRRRDVVVLPDFVSTAGPLLAAFPSGAAPVAPDAVDREAERRVTDAVAEVLGAERGPLLGACERAEAFLRSWQPQLPFGRPLAA